MARKSMRARTYLELGLGHLGSLVGFLFERVAYLDRKRLFREPFQELVVDCLVYEYSRPS